MPIQKEKRVIYFLMTFLLRKIVPASLVNLYIGISIYMRGMVQVNLNYTKGIDF
ncbi:hypothetical protein IX330_002282 [Bacteroides pyogenes]|nr:hypothetical protein [Bacteroides pyogenes]MBR8755741.1 hypothetical protein [Bacteroides pyogenes]MBR8794038.1 hypothetical protein [Bacteroides pyogenes]